MAALDFLIAAISLLAAGVVLMPSFTRAIAAFLLTHASGAEAYWSYWRKPVQKVKQVDYLDPCIGNRWDPKDSPIAWSDTPTHTK